MIHVYKEAGEKGTRLAWGSWKCFLGVLGA